MEGGLVVPAHVSSQMTSERFPAVGLPWSNSGLSPLDFSNPRVPARQARRQTRPIDQNVRDHPRHARDRTIGGENSGIGGMRQGRTRGHFVLLSGRFESIVWNGSEVPGKRMVGRSRIRPAADGGRRLLQAKTAAGFSVYSPAGFIPPTPIFNESFAVAKPPLSIQYRIPTGSRRMVRARPL